MRDGWLLAGDFNNIMLATQKRGGAPTSIWKFDPLNDRINSCNLVDIDSLGHKFTLQGPTNHRGLRIYEHMDI